MLPCFAAKAAEPVAPQPSQGSTGKTNQMAPVVITGKEEPTFKVDQVSSPKFTQPVLNTPQTIVAVPKEVFVQQGATTLSDVLRNTPGITFAAGEGGNVASGDSFYMRGSDATGSIFVDGVRDTGGYSRDIYNVEQVEIFKGPSGADSGRGGSSGSVNLATKTPHMEQSFGGMLSYGSAEQKRLSADLNQPLKLGDKGDWINGSALRLNGVWQDGGVPGRDFVENNRWAVAPSIALGLGTATRVSLAVSHMEQDNLPDSGLLIAAYPGVGTVPVSQENFYGLANQDYEDISNTRVVAKIEHDFTPDVTLRNQFVYTTTDRDALLTYFQNSATAATTFNPTNTPVNPATGAVPPSYTTYDPGSGTVVPRRMRTETENEIFSDQIGLNFTFQTGSIQHQAGTGFEFARETQKAPTWSPVGGPATSLTSPNPYRFATPAQTPYMATNSPYADGQIDSAAVYLFDTVELNRFFILNASVRLEHYKTQYDSLAASTIAAPNPSATELETDGDLFSWKAGLIFKPRPEGSIYFSYGNSFTPPGSGFTLSATANNQNNPNLDPQEARSFEVGIKWDFFEKRLSTSLAAYKTKNLNIVGTDAITGTTTQDPSEDIEGIEFGISGQLSRNWFVSGGISLMDAEREAGNTTTAATTDGATLRFSPAVGVSLWTEYKLPIGLRLGGGVLYTSTAVRSTSLNQPVTATSISEIPDYWILNAMAAYDFGKRFTVRLNVNNLLDEENNIRLNNNGGRYYSGTPLSFLLTAEARF